MDSKKQIHNNKYRYVHSTYSDREVHDVKLRLTHKRSVSLHVTTPQGFHFSDDIKANLPLFSSKV